MGAALFLLVSTAVVGSVVAQYPAVGCTRHVTMSPPTYSVPNYQPQCHCQCQQYQPHPPRMNLVSYNYCQPPSILQQNIVPPSSPVYQPPPIIVPLPPLPKDCQSAHTTVQQPTPEPGPPPRPSRYPHGHSPPGPNLRPSHSSIPGLSDADAKRLVPNMGNVGHNHPVVVQSVIVGKKEKEQEKESEEEKGRKEKGKGSYKKKKPKKKSSEEVEDYDEEEERCYRRRRRPRRKPRRRPYYEPFDPYFPFDPLLDPCAECDLNDGKSKKPVFMYC